MQYTIEQALEAIRSGRSDAAYAREYLTKLFNGFVRVRTQRGMCNLDDLEAISASESALST